MPATRFNLIDEGWIPVARKGSVDLRTIFTDSTITALGGNPVEKIALFKLLLAIAQSAYTPKDEEDWGKLGCGGMQKKVLEYLDEHYECFWLYGENPFLQMPQVLAASKIPYGSVQMEVATGNTSVVTEIQSEKQLTDAEKAVLLVTLMGFAFGGKKTDNSVVLTRGYMSKINEKGKPSTGKPGASLGFKGYMHTFAFLDTLVLSIYVNLLTDENIQRIAMYPGGIGTAPWLAMPSGEDDETARRLKNSYMGRLVPLSRFVLLEEDGIHYSEGVLHFGYMDSVVDPSVTVDFSARPKPKVLWTDPDRKPWRQLTSLLSFLDANNLNKFICFQLKEVLPRLAIYNSFSIWSGGIRVHTNAGEQYVSGNDDFVESQVKFGGGFFSDSRDFFMTLTEEMNYLENNAKIIFSCIFKYFAALKADGESIAGQATRVYWQLCEFQFQQLLNVCEADLGGRQAKDMRKFFDGFVYQIYDQTCQQDTARQMEAWAENRPFSRIKEEK
ncbi:MAG TPA: type I-E CRISPR-associated protein Cse1/CasA [Rectinema sp.]|nr:type I-E CRISPR-associated protein Cse1/CasA [Rectinema sp.]